MRDVNNGWLIRYAHANGASMFFILIYLHIARGLYFGSYTKPRVMLWSVGVVILILLVVIAFLGYVKTIISPKGFVKSFKNSLKFAPGSRRSYSTLVVPTKAFLEEKGLIPVKVYSNLSSPQTQALIKRELDSKSGIYLILNKLTEDFYVGSASTSRFYSRFRSHLINFSGSKILKGAVKKYGVEAFAFIILELYNPPGGSIDKVSNRVLLDLEDFYLKTLLPNYNILTEAGSSFGYTHTDITRIKMKSTYSLERRSQIGELNLGKTLSEETRKKLSLVKTGKLLLFSEEGYKAITKAVVVYNLDGTVKGKFQSIKEAAAALGCDRKTIRKSIQGSATLLKRYKVYFI